MSLRKINRIEIISPNGREYVKYLEKEQNIKLVKQDDGQTLKIFIDKTQMEAIDIENDQLIESLDDEFFFTNIKSTFRKVKNLLK